MNKEITSFAVALSFSAVLPVNAQTSIDEYLEKVGFVPDAVTAIKIAEAVASPIFGKDMVESERPFSALLEDGVWIVKGSMPGPKGKYVGGVLVVQISKRDGRIIKVAHGK